MGLDPARGKESNTGRVTTCQDKAGNNVSYKVVFIRVTGAQESPQQSRGKLMEAFILVPIVLIPLWFSIIFVLKKGVSNRVKLPPGTSGWPLLGESIQFNLLGPQKFINDRMKKYSEDVFQTSLLGEKTAIFCGAEGNKLLFTNDNKLVTRWLPNSIKKALIFPGEFAENNSMKKISALRRSFHLEGLKPEALKHYIPVMDKAAREHIEKEWSPNQQVKVFPLVKKYTFDLACLIFLNVEDQEQIKKLADPFHLVSKGILSMPINLPGTAYNGAIKGGKKVREELVKIIRERKKELIMENNKETLGRKRDRLSQMLLFTDEDGQFMSEIEIANKIIGLLLASFESTSTAVSFVLKHLAELPHIYDEVFKEVVAIAKTKGPDELLSWEDIEKMKYSWNVARESYRVTPPTQGAFRESLVDFTYAGFTIPKGWKIFWNVYTTHKNPKYFPDPEKFDPTRFEGSGPAPYTFVPFGGGPRMCPGKEYARLETLVFMYNVVRKFKLEKLYPNEDIIHRGTAPVPANGLPVRLQPHGK
ncbi:hypothetical protein ACH5RR_039091 [Cinchona calisaya]|uniref:Beta-amyrin 28-oxidase-like n=1 Tax=Cinchona calisaya TaxID=153742 RepID=A0ABD2Y2U5_9GENT